MRIKQEVLKEINKSNIIKAKLIEAYDMHPVTIQRWISDNDEQLTTAKSLQILCEQLDMTQRQILEDETKAA